MLFWLIVVTALLQRGMPAATGSYHRYVIVGAGPGGLQLGHFLHSARRDYVILDSSARPGSFFRTYPRMRQLISINKRIGGKLGLTALDHAMRHDWNSLLVEPSHSSRHAHRFFEVAAWHCPRHAVAATPVGNATCFAPAASSSDPRITLRSVPPGALFRDFSEDFYPHADHLVRYMEHFAGASSRRGNLSPCIALPGGEQTCDDAGTVGAAGEPLRIRYNSTVIRVSAHPAWAAAAAAGLSESARLATGVPRFLLTLQPQNGSGSANTEPQHLAATFLVWAAGLQTTVRSESPGIQAALDARWPGVYSYSTAPTDMAAYANKTVLVVGRGNAAFELANSMLEVAARVHVVGRHPRRVRLALETHYPGDVRLLHARLLETYLLKSLDGMLEVDLPNMTIERTASGRFIFLPHDRQASSAGASVSGSVNPFGCRRDAWGRDTNQACSTFTFEYDAVISCAGWKLDTSPFDASVRPELTGTGKHPATTPLFESADVPGLYFAGTLMHGRDSKRSSGGFIHGFRYLVRALHRHLEEVEAAVLADAYSNGLALPLALEAGHALPCSSETSAASDHGGGASASASNTSSPAAISISSPMLWPRRRLRGLRDAAHSLLNRINVAAGPYQMFGQLADVIVLPPLHIQPLDGAQTRSGGFSSHGVRAACDEPWAFPDAAAPNTYISQAPPPWTPPPAQPAPSSSPLAAAAEGSNTDNTDDVVDEDPFGVGEEVPPSHIHDNEGLSAYAFKRDSKQAAADVAIDSALRGGLLFEEVPVAAIPEKARAWCEQGASAAATVPGSEAAAGTAGEGLRAAATPGGCSLEAGLQFITLTLEYGGSHAPPYLQPAEHAAFHGAGAHQHYADLPSSARAAEAGFAGAPQGHYSDHYPQSAPSSRVVDPFSVARVNASAADAQFSTFLHPVLRFYHTAIWQQAEAAGHGAGPGAGHGSAAADSSDATLGQQHHQQHGHPQPLPTPALEVHLVEDFFVTFTSHTTHVLPVTRFLQDVGARRVQEALLQAAARQSQQPAHRPAGDLGDAYASAAEALQSAPEAGHSCADETHRSCAQSSADEGAYHVALASVWRSQVDGTPVLSAGTPALNEHGAPDARAALLLQLLAPRRSALYVDGVGIAGGHAWFHRLSRQAADAMLGYGRSEGHDSTSLPHGLLLHAIDPFPVAPAGDSESSRSASNEAVVRARLARLRRFHATCSVRLGRFPLVVVMARGSEEVEAVAGAAGVSSTPHTAMWLPHCGWQKVPANVADLEADSSRITSECAGYWLSSHYRYAADPGRGLDNDHGGISEPPSAQCIYDGGLQEQSPQIVCSKPNSEPGPATRYLPAEHVVCRHGGRGASCFDSLPLQSADESDYLHLERSQSENSLHHNIPPRVSPADHHAASASAAAPSSLAWQDDARADAALQDMCDAAIAMLQRFGAPRFDGAQLHTHSSVEPSSDSTVTAAP